MNRLWLVVARRYLWKDVALSHDRHALANQFAASRNTNTSLGNVMQKAQGAASSTMLEHVGHIFTLREPCAAFKLIFHRRLLSLL